jgi:hypothetical protein
MNFLDNDPNLSTAWRSIVLFGVNVASYKFALARALIDSADRSSDLVQMDELALPYAMHLCAHLRNADKQNTQSTSRFLEACRRYNANGISKAQLIDETKKYGFQEVLKAFHRVNGSDIEHRFFLDERKANGGIRLTDNYFQLFQGHNARTLGHETEARWRLVETAWELNVSANLLSVSHDSHEARFFIRHSGKRVDITSSRDALNGYQKGKCFYSFADISIQSGAIDLADVDHFFPHTLKQFSCVPHLDGVWNLVLASKECNRGRNGKHARVPSLRLLERLHRRNEYLIWSNHPLKESIILQTGRTTKNRSDFLQLCWAEAVGHLNRNALWEPESEAEACF